MVTHVYSGDLVTTGTAIYHVPDYEDIVVTRDADIVSTDSHGISAGGICTITVLGNVTSYGSAVFMDSTGHQSLFVGLGATLTTTQNVSGNAAVFSNNGDKDLYNAGTIAAPAAIGVLLFGGNNAIVNTGQIQGQSGVVMGYLNDAGDTLYNSGVIASGTSQSTSLGSFQLNAVFLGGGNGSITNTATGEIVAMAASGSAIRLDAEATASVITNAGVIHTLAGATAIDAAQVVLTTTTQSFFNSGTVQGMVNSYLGGAAVNGVVNSGRMIGNVVLGANDDFYDGRGGQVVGIVFGGAGNDSYSLSDNLTQISEVGGSGIDTVNVSFNYELRSQFENLNLSGTADLRAYGNELDNRINGNMGDNRINGGDGNDTIVALTGDDFVLGVAGNDQINGGFGNDSVWGGDGDDNMTGDGGDDMMSGGAGNDSMSAGAGDDMLNGGAGADRLTGGTGADLFLFSRASDVGAPLSPTDVVTDFAHLTDTLDFSGIDANAGLAGNQSFFFLNGGAFTGAGGELRYTRALGLLQMDLNGDGAADIEMTLTNHALLTVDDFIL